MSIDTLRQDLRDIINAAPKGGALATADDAVQFMRANLLPFLESLLDEVGEMDDSIEDIVHQSVDVLHADSAAVFAGIIEGGATLITELKTRCSGDARLLSMIKDWENLANQGREILEEIVIPEDEDDEDGEDGEDESEKDAHEEGNAP